jgi:hypothetical protein
VSFEWDGNELPYDAFCFTVDTAGIFTAETFAPTEGAELGDTMLVLTDEDGVVLAFNDDAEQGYYYSYVEAELEAGDYVISVLPYSDDLEGGYELDVDLQ